MSYRNAGIRTYGLTKLSRVLLPPYAHCVHVYLNRHTPFICLLQLASHWATKDNPSAQQTEVQKVFRTEAPSCAYS